jgi:diacylglycerol kinase
MRTSNKILKFINYQLRTFIFAFKGIVSFFSQEHKAYIHLFAAVIVVVMGWIFELSRNEWIAVVVAIGIVFIAEFFNTIVEHMADMVQPDKDPRIARIKDMAAGAVLIAALTALAIGLLIFIPKIELLF